MIGDASTGFGLQLPMFHALFDGPLSQIWPMMVFPALAALISDWSARRLPPTRADWRIAAALAASPGLVMAAIMLMVFGRAIRHWHLDTTAHFIEFHGSALIAAGLLLFATTRALRRQAELRRLTRFSTAPPPRLALAAAEAKVEVRELPDDRCECFASGIRRPIVFVSRGAVERMDDPELRAMLHHERAHLAAGDPALLTLLAFLRDLAPGSDRALQAYRASCERRADARAAQAAGRIALATALVAVVRPSAAPLPAIGMAGADEAAWRLQAILGIEPAATASSVSASVWGSLAANSTLVCWPAFHIWAAFMICC